MPSIIVKDTEAEVTPDTTGLTQAEINALSQAEKDDLKRVVEVREGVTELGKTYNSYYKEPNLSPLSVLMLTFTDILSFQNGRYSAFLFAESNEYALTFAGLNKKATGIKFDGTAGDPYEKVILKPVVDKFEDENGGENPGSKRYVMRIAFPKNDSRKSETTANGYVAGIVEDVVVKDSTSGRRDAARYTFGTISFRRCL